MPISTLGAVAPAATPAPTAPFPAGRSFGALLERHASHPPPASAPGAGTRLSAAATRGLEGLERAQARLDGVLASARSGRTFTAQELLALQGEAYRFSQAVELSAKLVEQGSQAVKQALHAQV